MCSPVAKVVYRNDLPSARLVKIRKERADDRTSQVAYVEALGDVWSGVLDDDLLSRARFVGAVFRLLGSGVIGEVVNLRKNGTEERGCVETEVEESFLVDYRFNVGICLKLRRRGVSYARGWTRGRGEYIKLLDIRAICIDGTMADTITVRSCAGLQCRIPIPSFQR